LIFPTLRPSNLLAFHFAEDEQKVEDYIRSLVYSARRSYDCDLLGPLSIRPGSSPVQSLEEIWNDCVQAIYGESRAPAAVRHWLLIGAACLFEVLDGMAGELDAGKLPDESASEKLNQLRHHLRLASGRAAGPDGSPRDWGPQ
jgi:hypothetical protein